MLGIRFIGGVGISNRSSIGSNWSIIRYNKWNVGGCSLIWSIESYNRLIIFILLSSSISSLWNKDWTWLV